MRGMILGLLVMVAINTHATVLVGSSTTTDFTTVASVNGNSGARAIAMQYVASQSGTATTLFVYANDRDESEIVKLFIANSAGTVLAVTDAVAFPGTPGGATWISGSIASTAITAGQTYYIGVYQSSNDGRVGVMSSGFGDYIDGTSGTYASPPATLSSLAADGGNANMLLYADGTTASSTVVNPITGKGGAAAHPITLH